MDLLQEFNLLLQGLSSVFGVEVGKGFVVQVLEKSKWFKSLITYRLDLTNKSTHLSLTRLHRVPVKVDMFYALGLQLNLFNVEMDRLIRIL